MKPYIYGFIIGAVFIFGVLLLIGWSAEQGAMNNSDNTNQA